MAEWHRMIRLQPGAPVLFHGARGVVRRLNPIRETYAVHLISEQRTVDVPFGAPELHADVSKRHVVPPSDDVPPMTNVSRHSLPAGGGGPCGGPAGGRRVAAPQPRSQSQCFSSARMMM